MDRRSERPGNRRWVGVVLSAGASTRFAGRPKALLPVGPESAVRRLVRISREEGCDRVIVVVGPHGAEISDELDPTAAEICPNPSWERGRTGSVQAGIARAGPGVDLLLWPVDHPFVDATTVRTLRKASEAGRGSAWVIPTYGGRGGHPVLIREEAAGRVQRLGPSTPLRSVLADLGPSVLRVPVADPGVLESSDTPASYRAAALAWSVRTGATDGP